MHFYQTKAKMQGLRIFIIVALFFVLASLLYTIWGEPTQCSASAPPLDPVPFREPQETLSSRQEQQPQQPPASDIRSSGNDDLFPGVEETPSVPLDSGLKPQKENWHPTTAYTDVQRMHYMDLIKARRNNDSNCGWSKKDQQEWLKRRAISEKAIAESLRPDPYTIVEGDQGGAKTGSTFHEENPYGLQWMHAQRYMLNGNSQITSALRQ